MSGVPDYNAVVELRPRRRLVPKVTDHPSERTDMAKPTIVLVHGAWADGSSWNAVSTELQGRASPS